MIETDRLLLRRWRPADFEPFAALNADPAVMRYFPKVLTRTESAALLARLGDRWAVDGFGFAAAEHKREGVLVGMVGLARVRGGVPLAGAVEIGWRLARAHWGRGYATEASRAWLAHGFAVLRVEEVVAFTVPANERSHAVMRRLGMRRDPARDFDHPDLPQGHRLRRHLVHALAAEDFRQ